MQKKSIDTVFEELVQCQQAQLHEAFTEKVNAASDKEYAANYYTNAYFQQNHLVGYASILMHETIVAYHHLSKLDSKTSLSELVSMLPVLRNISLESLQNAQRYKAGDQSIELHDHYQNQLLEKTHGLSELISIEEEVQQWSDNDMLTRLSIHVAGQRLLQDQQPEEEPTSQPASKKHKNNFTQKEQLLALFYLMESFGISMYLDASRTSMSALFHLIMGIPFDDYDKINNTNIYKSLAKAPEVVKDKQLLKYLQRIRLFFERAGLHNVVKNIDEQIIFLESHGEK